MRRNGNGFGSAGKTIESQVPFCMCVREKERVRKREGDAGTSGLEPNASTAFGIIGGEGCAMVPDLVMGWVFISIKTEAKLGPLYVRTL